MPRDRPPLEPPDRLMRPEEFASHTRPRNPTGWRFLPPLSIGGEIAAQVFMAVSAAAVAVVALALATGALSALVASGGLSTSERLLLAAIGGWFACQAAESALDLSPDPPAPWRERAQTWTPRVANAFAGLGFLFGVAVALGVG